MSNHFTLFFIIFVFCLTTFSFYTGIRLYSVLSGLHPLPPLPFWLAFAFVTAAYPIARWSQKYLPYGLTYVLNWIGSCWMGLFYYLFLFFLITDLLRAVLFLTPLKSYLLAGWHQLSPVMGSGTAGPATGPDVNAAAGTNLAGAVIACYLGWIAVILAVAVNMAGFFNARQQYIKEYRITINKSLFESSSLPENNSLSPTNPGTKLSPVASLQSPTSSQPPTPVQPEETAPPANLTAVFVSDLHIGLNFGRQQVERMVKTINNLQPDIIFLGGDIIEDINYFRHHSIAEVLANLRAPYGVYAVAGNHEYIGGRLQEKLEALTAAGITVLRDRVIRIEKSVPGGKLSFYVAGRDEVSRRYYRGQERLPLTALISGIDPSRPLILLDHQPVQIPEARECGVDLQLGGHTHLGQLFPNNFITRRVFLLDYGYLNRDNYHLVVSCGLGTWGPPVRTGSRGEIVVLHLNFHPQSG